jgi:hypothetical protein
MTVDKLACVARLNGFEEYRNVALSMTVISSDTDMKAADVPADILVVDDSSANLLAMESALGVLGCPIVRAQSGEEALRLLLQRDFALILLDVYCLSAKAGGQGHPRQGASSDSTLSGTASEPLVGC